MVPVDATATTGAVTFREVNWVCMEPSTATIHTGVSLARVPTSSSPSGRQPTDTAVSPRFVATGTGVPSRTPAESWDSSEPEEFSRTLTNSRPLMIIAARVPSRDTVNSLIVGLSSPRLFSVAKSTVASDIRPDAVMDHRRTCSPSVTAYSHWPSAVQEGREIWSEVFTVTGLPSGVPTRRLRGSSPWPETAATVPSEEYAADSSSPDAVQPPTEVAPSSETSTRAPSRRARNGSSGTAWGSRSRASSMLHVSPGSDCPLPTGTPSARIRYGPRTSESASVQMICAASVRTPSASIADRPCRSTVNPPDSPSRAFTTTSEDRDETTPSARLSLGPAASREINDEPTFSCRE